MSLEAHETMAIVTPPALTRAEPPRDVRSAADLLPPRTLEEIRAVEAVFAQQDRENATVAGLVNVWTAAMVLRDVHQDTFSEPAGDVEAKLKVKKGKES